MSDYVRYYNSRQLAYRELGVQWSRWAKTAKLTTTEKVGITRFFKRLAVRFGLVREYRRLGII
jgi:hypothetical protein